jgi:hypothetical protein
MHKESIRWISIVAGLVGTVVGIVALALHIQSSDYDSRIASLENNHKTEIKTFETEYRRQVDELMDRNEALEGKIAELEKTFNSLDSVLRKLAKLIADRAADRLSEMAKILDNNRMANQSVIQLLDEFSHSYRESNEHSERIQATFSKYYDSVNQTMEAYDQWHSEIQVVLIDFETWLAEREERNASLIKGKRNVNRSSNIVALEIPVTEEMKRQARKELRVLRKARALKHQLDDDRRITKTEP